MHEHVIYFWHGWPCQATAGAAAHTVFFVIFCIREKKPLSKTKNNKKDAIASQY